MSLKLAFTRSLNILAVVLVVSCAKTQDDPILPPIVENDSIEVINEAVLSDVVQVFALFRTVDGDILLGGASQDKAVVYRSTNSGAIWIKVAELGEGGPGDPVMGFAQLANGQIFAIINRSDYLYVSNDGSQFTQLDQAPFHIGGRAAKLRAFENRLYIAANGDNQVVDLHYSDDRGSSWTSVDSVLSRGSTIFEITPLGNLVIGSCGCGGNQERELIVASHFDLQMRKTQFGIYDNSNGAPRILLHENAEGILVLGGRSHKYIAAPGNNFIYAGLMLGSEDYYIRGGLEMSDYILLSTQLMSSDNTYKYHISRDDGETFQEYESDGRFYDIMLPISSTDILGVDTCEHSSDNPTKVVRLRAPKN